MTLQQRISLNIDLTINNEPLDLYGERARVFLRKGRGESMRHVMMKLVSYILFYHEDLLIEAPADQHHKPDLVRFDLMRRPIQWVDCGQTSLQKLERISRRNRETFIDIVKATGGELEPYKLQADARVSRSERVRYWSFRDYFIEELGELMNNRRHSITATVSPDHEQLYLLIDDAITLSSPITFLGNAPLPGAQISPQDERASYMA